MIRNVGLRRVQGIVLLAVLITTGASAHADPESPSSVRFNAPKSVGNALDIVPTKYRGAVSRSFRSDPKLVELTEPLVVYRRWGGRASEVGSPWFSPKPYTKPGNAQRYLALPEGNTAQNLTRFEIPAGTQILRGKVAGQAGEAGFGGNAVGGGVQIYLPALRVAVPIR